MLIDYYPRRHTGGKIEKMQRAFQPSVDALPTAFGDFINQLFVGTATWGLDYFERDLGLLSNNNLSIAQRRERIVARLMGTGVTTVAVVLDIAETLSGKECVVAEHPENYSFDIEFLGKPGSPVNIDTICSAVDEIKPAHLAYRTIYTLFSHRQAVCTGTALEKHKTTVMLNSSVLSHRYGDTIFTGTAHCGLKKTALFDHTILAQKFSTAVYGGVGAEIYKSTVLK